MLHPRRPWIRSPFRRSALLLVGLMPLYALASMRAAPVQDDRAGNEVGPRSIVVHLGPSLDGWERTRTVSVQLRSQGAPLDVELVVEAQPRHVSVECEPAVQRAVAPDGVARFRVTLRGRPQAAGESFVLVFRDRARGVELGEIPVGVERGVVIVPRPLKKTIGGRLLELRNAVDAGEFDVGNRDKAVEELDEAIEELIESLDLELWAQKDDGGVDPERLDPKHGRHVFHEESECVEEIFDALGKGKIRDQTLSDELETAIDFLVLDDRRLAEVAIQDAVDAGGDAHEIEDALEALADGDERVEKAADESDLEDRSELLVHAIDHDYRHAWEEAIEALE